MQIWICRCLLIGDAVFCCLMMQELVCRCLLLYDAGKDAVGFAASRTGCCVVSWYLQRDVVRRPKLILRRLSEIAIKSAGDHFRKLALKRSFWESCCDWLESRIGCTESVAVIGWTPRQSLTAGRGFHVGCRLQREAQIPLLRVRIPSAACSCFLLLPTRQDLTQGLFLVGILGKGTSRDSCSVRLCWS